MAISDASLHETEVAARPPALMAAGMPQRISVHRNVVANVLGGAWAALVGLAFIPMYIRYLGIESYGLIGFFATLQAWCFLLDLGLSGTLNREMARFSAGGILAQAIRDLVKSVELLYAGIACLVGLIVAGLSQVIARDWINAQTLSTDDLARAILLMGLALAFQWMGTLYRGAFLGLHLHVWLSLMNAVMATVRGAGAVLVMAYVSPTIVAFFVFQCVVGAVESLVLRWYLRRHLPHPLSPPRFSRKALRSVWKFAAGLAAVGVLATLLTQVDKLLLARLLPLGEFGYFTLAVTVAGALAALIVPVTNVAYPRLSELVAIGDEAALAVQYHKFAQLVSIGVLPPATVLCLFSRQIVYLWTGDPAMADAVAPLLSVWVVGTALNGLMHVPYAAQLAHGWPRLAIGMNAVAVVAVMPLLLILVPRYGALAAAWIWVAINASYVLFGISAMHRRILLSQKWKWYVQDVLSPLAAGSVVAALMLVLHASYPGMNQSRELSFLLAGVLALGLAMTLAVPSGRQALYEITGYAARQKDRL